MGNYIYHSIYQYRNIEDDYYLISLKYINKIKVNNDVIIINNDKEDNNFIKKKKGKKINVIKTEKIERKKSYKINEIKEIIKDDVSKTNNINNIQFLKDLTIDSYSILGFDNTFETFISIDNNLYLIYSDKNRSIISYNIINNQKLNEVRNAHNKYITNFRHYLDKFNKRDLIISISGYDNNIKLWEINNWQCLLDMKNIYFGGYLYSACFLNNSNNITYIISSNYNIYCPEPIKIFNLCGEKINELNNSKDDTYFIDTYYDKKNYNIYIISGIHGGVKSYNYIKNTIFHHYSDNSHFKFAYTSIIINNEEDLISLIASCHDGNIKIWNFYSGEFLNKIKVINYELYGLCLWDCQYIIVGGNNNEIKIIDIKKGFIIKDLKTNYNRTLTIKKINHYKYGDCLISQGLYNEQIKMWKNL